MKKAVSILLTAVLALGTVGCGKETEWKEKDLTVQEYSIYNSVATDALNRSYGTIDGKVKDKYIGMFFSQWHNAYDPDYKIYDLSLIRRMYPEDEDWLYLDDPETTPMNGSHYIAEPLYGYYSSSDEWVLRKQLEMMTFSGIDFIMLDVTNGFHYASCRELLLRLICEYRQKGWPAPQVAFMMNDNSKEMLYTLYHDILEPGIYDDAIFKIGGKAYVTANMDQLNDPDNVFALLTQDILDQFTIRHTQWPTDVYHDNAMPWTDFGFPQTNYDGAMSVNVAVHAGLPMSDSDLLRDDEFYRNKNWGRGFDHDTGINYPNKILEGLQFEQSWDWAISQRDALELVMVSSWNEWIVGKGRMPTKPFVGFVDTFNYEYSKDIELMKPKPGYENYSDNFYLQLNRKIREFAGVGEEDSYYKIRTPEKFGLYLSDGKWGDYGMEYADFTGEAIRRDYRGYSEEVHYTDETNRNDIARVRVVSDDTSLYFMVETLDDIIQEYDTGWMNILIDTGEEGGWNGYDYVLNRSADGKRTSLEENVGDGYSWHKVADVNMNIDKNRIIVQIPLRLLKLDRDNFTLDFKVTDNLQKPDDITDYYVSGDSAPIGRMNYRYAYKKG